MNDDMRIFYTLMAVSVILILNIASCESQKIGYNHVEKMEAIKRFNLKVINESR